MFFFYKFQQQYKLKIVKHNKKIFNVALKVYILDIYSTQSKEEKVSLKIIKFMNNKEDVNLHV